MPRWFYTHLIGPEGPEDDDFYYRADAEVEVRPTGAVAQVSNLFGKVFRFRLERIGKIWRGHLDCHNPEKGHGWPLETGDARICLHDLCLSPQSHPPLGHPFSVGDSLDILSDATLVGTCKVTRIIDYRHQAIDLCRPKQ
jgi:hypothetical protein